MTEVSEYANNCRIVFVVYLSTLVKARLMILTQESCKKASKKMINVDL